MTENPGGTARFARRAPVPDPDALVGRVLGVATGSRSLLHGEGHWQRVATAGLALLPETPGANPALVFLFALFHDSMRLSDGHDPLHGSRGGRLSGLLRGNLFSISDDRMDRLRFACEWHDAGRVSDDPTVGVCWDADRLNLWRVGLRPAPELLSTPAARSPRRIEWARRLQHSSPPPWNAIAAGFGVGRGR